MRENRVLGRLQFWRRAEKPIVPEDVAVEEVKKLVEDTLKNEFGDVHADSKRNELSERVKRWKGKLSVNLENVANDVTAESMMGECGSISGELALSLWEKDSDVDFGISGDLRYPHGFLVISYEGYDVIVDPTIAQFVTTHRNVFVGTYRQLKEMVVSNAHPETFAQDFKYFLEAPIDSVWGEKSQRFTLDPQPYYNDSREIRSSHKVIN